ncbi:siderophore-interacting protein [Pedobacter sp. MC2016-15]|uniref:siderophore-interacting protein n=1 Tax=Pedobacter sp. MC2016-15 TaxID=2994473 RepID=UPI0022457E8C|nr:siderophore-interacting protein [Pedobacter sp. MC2016-15]MCX2479880.1 siderophore-interacting protein [Pedobacter sp. MC2016-15]
MEISFIKQLKNKAGRLIENQLLKTGRVNDVRNLESSGLIELEVHLPHINMHNWNQVPYIKFRVDDLSFRDYTPFGWDAETSTCSVIIDSDHQGPGSQWAKNLQTGDTIYYIGTDSTRQSPHPTDFVVGLGDASGIGHLLALQQLTVPVSRFESAVVIDSSETGQLLQENYSPALNIMSSIEELAGWLVKQGYCTAHTWFYLIGNNQMVVALRKQLKSMGHSHIQVKGFWN